MFGSNMTLLQERAREGMIMSIFKALLAESLTQSPFHWLDLVGSTEYVFPLHPGQMYPHTFDLVLAEKY